MTRPPLTLESSILIIGAGTWGCSTALHLARRGYRNVRVLDPFAVPSPIAAGNDINKIMEHKELKGIVLHSPQIQSICPRRHIRRTMRPRIDSNSLFFFCLIRKPSRSQKCGVRHLYPSSFEGMANRPRLCSIFPRDWIHRCRKHPRAHRTSQEARDRSHAS